MKTVGGWQKDGQVIIDGSNERWEPFQSDVSDLEM